MADKETIVENVKITLACIFLILVVALFVTAGTFNSSQAEKCKEIGMSWVKEAPFGDYGCAVIVPVPE